MWALVWALVWALAAMAEMPVHMEPEEALMGQSVTMDMGIT